MGLVSLFVVAIISLGTYAIWNSELLTGDNTIKSGQIKMSYTETNEITMENALPMKDEEGKVLEKYFDFQVLTYIKTRANDSTQRKLSYDVILKPLTVETPLKDNEIKVYLTMVENGKETEVVKPTTIDKLINYLLNTHEDIFSNNKGEVVTSYRLRAWVDEKVDPAKFNEKKYSYKFRVNVNSGKINELVDADTSGANVPELTSNMIPVYYDEKNDVWRKADTSNKNSNWYNYDKKKWANAVTVSNFGNYKSVVNNNEIGGNFGRAEISSYYETQNSSVTINNSYKNGSTYYYRCCSSSKPTLDTSKGYYALSGSWTRADLMNGKYCNSSYYNTTTGSCNYDVSTINYMSARGTSTTSGNVGYYYWTTTEYTSTPVYTPKNYKLSSTYSFNTTTGKYTLTNPITKTYSSYYVNYYYCPDQVSTTCSTMYKIKKVNDNYRWISEVEEYIAEQNISATSTDYEVGEEIPMDKISTMWTWIPRYKYTYFKSGEPQEIQIKFENQTESTGTIKCTDNISGTGSTSETCTDTTNGGLKTGVSTYTHPAFNFGGKQLTGIWVGKFRNSATGVPQVENNPDIIFTDSTIIIKPDVNSLTHKAVSNIFKDIRQMEKANNPYGFSQSSSTTFNFNGNLTGDNNNLDTHLMKNMEYGAVMYLSHSKYGLNAELNYNNSSSRYTGRSGGNVGTKANEIYTDTEDESLYNKYGYYTYNGYLLDYNTNNKSKTRDMSKVASTTGNIYGVYDMNGYSMEYVMGNMVNESNQFQVSSAYNWSTTLTPLSKYYDSYTYGTTWNDNAAYARGKLGDATIELDPAVSQWYSSSSSSFMHRTSPWLERMGFYFIFDSGNDFTRTASSHSVLNILN